MKGIYHSSKTGCLEGPATVDITTTGRVRFRKVVFSEGWEYEAYDVETGERLDFVGVEESLGGENLNYTCERLPELKYFGRV